MVMMNSTGIHLTAFKHQKQDPLRSVPGTAIIQLFILFQSYKGIHFRDPYRYVVNGRGLKQGINLKVK